MDQRDQFVDLEIHLRLDHTPQGDTEEPAENLRVEVRMHVEDPGADQLDPDTYQTVEISSRLIGKALTPGYGNELRDQIFVGALLERYQQIRTMVADRQGSTGERQTELRVRLYVDPGAERLHGLRWELMTDPVDGMSWWTYERVVFSRVLSSQGLARVVLRPRENYSDPLSAVIAIAAPSGLPPDMAPIDFEEQAGHVREALAELRGPFGKQANEVGGGGEKLTLQRLIDAIDVKEGVDVLYLASHGMMSRRGDPLVFLADEQGQVAPVSGKELADRIRALRAAPRLVYLASCESAGTEKDTGFEQRSAAQSSLAQLLVRAGVCAVVAMQGKISMETNKRLAPRFLAALGRHGRVDRALAHARQDIAADCLDAWMPVLYCRLKSAALWYEPEFAGWEEDAALLDDLRTACEEGRCVPVIGPEDIEAEVGTPSEVAARVTHKYQFGPSTSDGDDLLKVAQRLVDAKGRETAMKIVQDEWRALILERDAQLGGVRSPLESVFQAVARKLVEADPNHPYRKLAQLGAYMYVDAGLCGLLLDGMQIGRTKRIRSLFAPVRAALKTPAPSGGPVRKRSGMTVYHAFGAIDKPESLVLTDQDLSDLTASPEGVRSLNNAVTSVRRNSILIAGFALGDRRLRSLLSMLLRGSGRPAVRQVLILADPAQYSSQEANAALKALKKDYPHHEGGSPIQIFRGNLADLLSQLGQVRNKATGLRAFLWDLLDWFRKLVSRRDLAWAAGLLAALALAAAAWFPLPREILFDRPYTQVTPPMFHVSYVTVAESSVQICQDMLDECRAIVKRPPSLAAAPVPVVQFDQMRPDMHRGFQYSMPASGRLDLEELDLCVTLDESRLAAWSGSCNGRRSDQVSRNRNGEVELRRPPYVFLVRATKENGENAVIVRMLASSDAAE